METRQPNVVLITTHDINPHLGCYDGFYPGARWFQTPNLDQLAHDGVLFTQAFSTNPICAPSRSALMTGCYPTSIGTCQMRTKAVLPEGVRLFPEYLREHGYYTTNNWFTDFQVKVPRSAFDDCSPTAHWRGRDSQQRPFFAAFHGMSTHESQIYLTESDHLGRTPHVTQHHRPEQAPLPPTHLDSRVFRTAWARYADLITEMDHWVGTILRDLEEDGLADSTLVIFCSDHGAGFPRYKRWPYDSGLHVPLLMRWPGVLDKGATSDGLVCLTDLAPTILAACHVPVPSTIQGTPLLTPDGHLKPRPHAYLFGGRDRQGDCFDSSRTVRDTRLRYIRHLHPDRPAMQHNAYPDQTPPWQEMRQLRVRELNEQVAAGRVPSLLTDVQRDVLAAKKPAEELYDLLTDPYETHNLAGDPGYEHDLVRLRSALDRWVQQVGDLGQVPEEELAEQWRPGGLPRRCKTPTWWTDTTGTLHADCATAGACVVWTADAPDQRFTADRSDDPGASADCLGAAIGMPAADGRHWRVLCAQWQPTSGEDIWLRACRAGYDDSDDDVVHLPPHGRLDRTRR